MKSYTGYSVYEMCVFAYEMQVWPYKESIIGQSHVRLDNLLFEGCELGSDALPSCTIQKQHCPGTSNKPQIELGRLVCSK